MKTVLTDEELVLASMKPIERKVLTGKGKGDLMESLRSVEKAVLQSEQVQAWKKDAERYRYARDNIMEDHELPGSYHLSEEGEYWDKTIDAAMKEQP